MLAQSTPGPCSAVVPLADLVASGWTRSRIRAQLHAGRWQRAGRAVVLHNGPLPRDHSRQVVLLNCGPRVALTAFTAAEVVGLIGWTREPIHVLVPGGTKVRRDHGIAMRVHYVGTWDARELAPAGDIHRLNHALIRAASTMSGVRSACGLLAASVQQRLTRPADLVAALSAAPQTRHHGALLLAVHDIAQGAQALSEIDFSRLCRRYGFPEPTRQRVRRDRSGRRRYLDVEWVLADGRRVVVEVDGALHLVAERWWADQLRQNDLAIEGNMVLRFPSVVIRFEEQLVATQLRRALT